MAMKKSAGQYQAVSVDGVGSDPWAIHVKAKMVELESVKAASDRKWGENRLCTLVDSSTLEKFWTQRSRVQQSIGQKDQHRFDAAVAGMIRAYAVLDGLAAAAGHQVAGQGIERIEWTMQDGSTMVVVRSHSDAVAIRTARPDVQGQHIWSLEELEVIMQSDIVQDIIRIKKIAPGAKTVAFGSSKPGGATGFDDFENDLTFSDNQKTESRFNIKAAEEYRDGQIKAISGANARKGTGHRPGGQKSF